MIYIIFAVIMLLIILVSGFIGIFAKSAGAIATAVLTGIFFVIVTAVASATVVEARAVGIQTSFGSYNNTLSNGLHFIAPWSEVEQFSTMIQPLDLNGTEDAVQVNFLGGGRGTVEATPRWRIDQKKAEDLWKKYRTFDAVRDQLVKSSARDSFRVVVAKYTPNTARSGESLRPISEGVQADLNKTLGNDGIILDSVSITGIKLDEPTQRAIERTVTANQDIERARSEQERARIDAATAKLREQQGALSSAALQRLCLDVTDNWAVGVNGPLPATWNCLAGGAPAGVIVGGR